MTDPNAPSPTWDDIRGGLAAAPETFQQPSIAASLVQSGLSAADLQGAAQGAVGAVQASAADAVVQEHKKQGIFGHLTSAVTHTVSGVWDSVPGHGVINDVAQTVADPLKKPLATVAGWANYPLSQVQHSYRYYHDVAVHHGVGAALTTYLTNSMGGLNPIAGVAAPAVDSGVASVTGNAVPSSALSPYYKDSWDRSANATVSPGRDLAALFQLKPGTSWQGAAYNAVSGTGDAAFDIGMDPLLKASTVSKAITGSARALATVEDVERMAAASRLNPIASPFQRAVKDIAATNSSVQIGEKYQPLRNITTTIGKGTDAEKKVALTTELAKADTEDKVIDVLRNHFATGSYLGYSGTPTYSFTKIPFRALNNKIDTWRQDPKGLLSEAVDNPDAASNKTGALAGFKSGVSRAVNQFTNKTPFVFNDKNELVSDAVNPASPQAAHALYRVLQYGQSEHVASTVADSFANAPTIAEKVSIWNKAVVGLANAVGIPDDAEFRNRFIGDLDGMATVTGSGADTKYGFDHLGNDLSYVEMEDGTKVAAPLFTSQGGLLSIPSLGEFNTAARAVRAFGKMYGPMDDFVYNTFTAGYFKKWALFSGGFAVRNAMSEMMTRVIGADGLKVVHSGITTAAMRLGVTLHPNELEDVAGQLAYSADPAHVKTLLADPNQTQVAAEFALRHNTTLMTPASVAAGHTAAYDAGDATRGFAENVSRVLSPGFKGARLDPERYVKYTQTAGVERLSNVVSGHATLIARDEGARVQAQAYRKSLGDQQSAAADVRSEVWKQRYNAKRADLEAKSPQITETRPVSDAERAAFQPGTVEPAASGLPPLFHGSKNPLPSTPGDRFMGAAADNLFGPGLYTTDSEKIAKQYARGGAHYSLHLPSGKNPKVLDLDAAAPSWLKDSVKSAAATEGIELPDVAGQSAADLIRSLRTELASEGLTTSLADEIVHSVTDSVESNGYDAMTHLGGVYASKSGERHQVYIWLHPEGMTAKARSMPSTLSETRDMTDVEKHAAAQKAADDYTGAKYRPTSAGEMQDKAAKDATAAGVDWMKNTVAGRAAQDAIKRSNSASTFGNDYLIDWAGQRVAAIRGVTTNADGDVIKPLLDGIADTEGSATHVNLHPDKVKALGIDNLPVNGVPGMAVIETAVDKPVSRLVNAGYSHIITPIIQNLARNPIFQSHLKDELSIALKVPGLSRDEAWHMAESRASERMVQEIHNPLDKSMFAQSVRNLIPFYFAREQAATRFIKAMHEDPFGWRKLQLAVHGMKDAGFVHTDPQSGQMYFNYPLSGELGKFLPMALNKMGVPTTVGVPSGFRGDITGLAPGGDVPGEGPTSVGWSPLVTIPMNSLADHFPELRPLVSSSAGVGAIGASQGLWEQLMPSATMRNVVKAYAGDHSRAFTGSMIDAMQYQMAHGNMPPTNAQPGDPAWQAWIDGIRNQTRAMFGVRALMGIGSPTSPILENGDHGMTAEYQALIQKDGLSAGTQEFLTKYPNAGAYTIFKSEGAGGVNVPETTAAWDWTKNNEKFVTKYGEAGSLFIPQTNQSDPNALSIYQQQMAAGFRHMKLPDEFAQQVMVQEGWNQYEADKANHDATVKSLTDPNAVSAENANWYAYVSNNLGPAHPLWFADYNNNTARNAQKKIIVGQLQDIFDSGKAPDSPMTPMLQGLLQDYKTYQEQLASSATSTMSKTEMKDNWNSYLATVAKDQPQLTTVINRVFKGA